MKKFKNVAAAMMSALMVAGMGSTAMAATQNGDVVVDNSGNVEIVIYDTSTSQALDTKTVSAKEAFTLEWGDGYGIAAGLTVDYANALIPDGYELSSIHISTAEAMASYSGLYLGVQSGVSYVWLAGDDGTSVFYKLEVQPESTGSGSTTVVSYTGDVISEIAAAAANGVGAVKTEGLTTLSIDVMRALAEYKVALEMNFTYNGAEYNITIPAGEAVVDEDILWYGPLYLNAVYGQSGAGTSETASESGSTYTVVSGDTLSLIAARHDMSLAELTGKNPQITNINLIFPGQVINL